jgi:predicted dehydrogenase
MSAIRFGIIGAGKIASEYDSDEAFNILTHAHAIISTDGAELAGFYDIQMSASMAAAQKWGGVPYQSLNHLLRDNIDVVIVCVPDAQHHEILWRIIDKPPKLVICEKPLTLNHEESCLIYDAYKLKNIGLWINYQRRFDPIIQKLAIDYRSGKFGKFLSGSLIYEKGIKHNGSHGVDLLRFILGEPSGLLSIFKRYDYGDDDPTIGGALHFGCGLVALIPCSQIYYSIFEIDLFFENVRHKLHYSGMQLTSSFPAEDPVFRGYKELLNERTIKTGLLESLAHLINCGVQWVNNGGIESPCEADKILHTQLICERLADAKLMVFETIEKY